MIKPLRGITVVDLSRALAGPYCTALLADMGARIIKVESINGGDTARQWPPFQDGHSLYFDSVNRNKASVCLDFYSAEGREILGRLIANADVLVENFKPGTLDKMGLTAERLEELNPSLVVGSVNGFGNAGPLKDHAGLDQVIQGMSGLMSVTGAGPGSNYRVGVPIVDITSGMVCAFGIVAALLGRRNGEPVRRVSTSLLETALNLSAFQGQKALSLGEAPSPQGNNHPVIAPYGMFTTATDPVNIAVGSDKQWRAFCGLLGIPLAVEDPRFLTGADRSANREQLTGLIETALAAKPAAEWVPMISQAGIPCGPIYDYTQALASEQVAALGLVQQRRRRDGSVLPLLRGPLSLDGGASEILSPPPLLGEHTAEVLREMGFSEEDIERLEATGKVMNNSVMGTESTAGARP
ncbi:CaiB/BaiF CoA-transferase family protein [Arthrobacter sp. CJ23]|uniref:CaiB/BaiF CoA transferase family protein n=1 Tax=Arthrobacter sp. CJ23 TaxID=2972479 RepID=UPI00215CC3D3|nr:CaiB/BaiF CoA-transferase family protein [Arthrobacter sp. CJ23]UVJ39035.1 CoA transferase [Arthrobacter sp. CJ23]